MRYLDNLIRLLLYDGTYSLKTSYNQIVPLSRNSGTKEHVYHKIFETEHIFPFNILARRVRNTYSYKKIDHKKYVEGKVDLLSDVATPRLAEFHFLTEINIFSFSFIYSQLYLSSFLHRYIYTKRALVIMEILSQLKLSPFQKLYKKKENKAIKHETGIKTYTGCVLRRNTDERHFGSY